MAEHSTLEQQQRLVGPDGVTYYIGDGIVCNPLNIVSAEASATAGISECIQSHVTTTIIPRFESVAVGGAIPTDIPQAFVLYGVRSLVGTPAPVIGIARQAIVAGKSGSCAGQGSILTCKCLTSPTSAVVGGPAIKSSTAGTVDLIAIATAVTNGQGVGVQIKLPGTSAGQTGSTSQAGIIVALK